MFLGQMCVLHGGLKIGVAYRLFHMHGVFPLSDPCGDGGHAQPTAHSAIAFQQVHGAVSRIGVSEMAFPHRYDHYLSMMHPATDDPSDTEKMIAWAREGWQALKPFGEGLYVNLLEDADEEGQDRVRDAYGPNYGRLLDLKRKYDPTNLFRQNANIIP